MSTHVKKPASTPEPATKRSAIRSGTVGRLIRIKAVDASITVVAFLVLFAGYAVWLGDLFTSPEARMLDVHQNVPILLLGLAVMLTLIAGQFDLSVASMATLTTFLTIGLTTQQGWPFAVVLAVCIAVGVVGGLINGLLVEALGINAFIATLGSGGVFLGLSAVYSGGTQVVPGTDGPYVPQWFTDLGSYGTKFPAWITVIGVVVAAVASFAALDSLRPTRVSEGRWAAMRIGVVLAVLVVLLVVFDLAEWIENISWLVALLLGVATMLWILLQWTAFGRRLRASGANRTAARLAGVNVHREVIAAFVLGGVLAALAGVLVASGQGSAAPDVGQTFLLPAFAAAFLSTVVFSTGQFTVWGAIVGGTFLGWVSQGLIVGGLPGTWTDVVNGLVLVAAVALSSVLRRARR